MKMAAGEVGQDVQGVSQDCPWHRRLETCQVSTGDQDPSLPLCNSNKKVMVTSQTNWAGKYAENLFPHWL